MPFVDSQARFTEFTDPDDVPRAVITMGGAMSSGSIELDFHQHRKAQVMLSLRGVLTCESAEGLWMVPSQSAIWIPGSARHSVKAAGPVEAYAVFIDPIVAPKMPLTCCTISVSPLLRELVVRSASFATDYPEGGIESHVATLLLDEVAAAPFGKLHVPMPTDARLRRIVDMIIAAPANRGTMGSWAKRVGLSERTLARIIERQTGMSFGRWRQQLSIVLAMQWLARGESIQQVAAALGYESAGSFVTMFRKAVGTSPGRYMARGRSRGVSPKKGSAGGD